MYTVVKELRPTIPSRREVTMVTFEGIATNIPEKSPLVSLSRSGGRNAQGKITIRHHGDGAKRKYRIIGLKRNKDSASARVATIECDPDRTTYTALVVYTDGEKRYVIAPAGLKVGGVIVSGPNTDIGVSNTFPLENIPVDTFVRNVELRVGKGTQMVKSAGTTAQSMAKESNYAALGLPSGRVRYVRIKCRAIISTVSNITNDIINISKAGGKRHMGWRLAIRGPAVDPNDHPHGGGGGRLLIGRPSPVTPRGKPALGYKTRKNKKYSDRFIIKKRNDR